MKNIFLCLSLLFLFCASSQTGIAQKTRKEKLESVKRSVDDELILSPSQKRPIYFTVDPKNCNCREFTIDGVDYKQMTHNNKVITVSHSFWKGYVMFFLAVKNLSDAYEFTFDPLESVMDYTKDADFLPDFKSYKTQYAINPERIANRLESRARWANALGAMGASMQRQTTTSQISGTASVYDSNGNSTNGTYIGTTTTTAPDYEARRRAGQTASRNTQRAQSAANTVMELGFKKNTIFPQQTVSGTIFFKNEKFKHGFIIFPVDGYQYTLAYDLTEEGK